MLYTPHTPSDQEQMLRTIGIDSIEELYQHIPETLRNRAKIDLPGGLTELAVRRRLAALASSNATASDWIATHAHSLRITGDAAGADHTKVFFPCPWIDEHTTGHNDREAALFVDDAGSVGFHCFHSHCQGRTVSDVAAALGLPDPFPEVVIEGVEEQERSGPLTEQRFAELLVARDGQDFRYVLERKRWYAWTGKCWGDSSLEEERRAQALATEVYAAACKTLNKKVIGAALKAQTEPFQRHALVLARSTCTTHITDFDQHPLWLNVENGTLDLTDPTAPVLRPHNRADLLTRLTPVFYDPSATSPEWDGFSPTSSPTPTCGPTSSASWACLSSRSLCK